jgi:hypothetical protein
MPPLLPLASSLLERFYPFVLLAVFLALVIAVINVHGRRLERHQDWLRQLEGRVTNLHKQKRDAYVQSLQIPPPLSEARTVEVSEEMLNTLKLQSKQKGPD